MNLRLRPVYFYNLIRECLNIESVEYCYFIPLIAETAEYWGDTKLIFTCNIMSRQVKQYFNYAAHIYLYMSKNNKDLKENSFFKDNYLSFHKNMNTMSQYKDLQCYKSENPNLELIRCEALKKVHFQDSFFQNTYETEKKSLGNDSNEIDKKNCEILESITRNVDQKECINNISKTLLLNTRSSVHNKNCFRLLKTLQYRKLWKANNWYPLLSKIAYDQQMLHVSHNFMQMSRSEKKISQLLRCRHER
jgi:hypothetical protein